MKYTVEESAENAYDKADSSSHEGRVHSGYPSELYGLTL